MNAYRDRDGLAHFIEVWWWASLSGRIVRYVLALAIFPIMAVRKALQDDDRDARVLLLITASLGTALPVAGGLLLSQFYSLLYASGAAAASYLGFGVISDIFHASWRDCPPRGGFL